MTAKKFQPFTTSVGGVSRHVVVMGKGFWTERLDDGRLVHHLGNLLINGQTEGRWLDQPKPCSRCKQPSWTATPRGRAVHDTCEGMLDTMPDEHLSRIIFGVAAMLGATVVQA